LLLSFVFTGSSIGCLLFLGFDYLIPVTAVAKFFIGMSFILSYQFTLEIYETHNRVTALGTCSGMGRLGGMVMPIVSIYSSEAYVLMPYFFFFIAATVSAISLGLISYETLG
jgi:hypothetical protein